MMKKAAQKEIAILRRLNAKDRDGMGLMLRYIIQMAVSDVLSSVTLTSPFFYR